MADDRARVLAWLTANPTKGYKRCARELVLDVEQVTAWGKEPRGSGSVMSLPTPGARAREPEPPAPAPEPAGPKRLPPVPVCPDDEEPATWRARLRPLEYHLVVQELIEQAVGDAMGAEKVNTAGLAALFKRAEDNKARLVALADERPDVLSGLPPAELREHVRQMVREWPAIALEAVFTEYSERLGGRVLFVGDGGHRATWDPDSQVWVPDASRAG